LKKSLVILCGVFIGFGWWNVCGGEFVTASNAMVATFELRDCFESPPLRSSRKQSVTSTARPQRAMLPLAYNPVTEILQNGNSSVL